MDPPSEGKPPHLLKHYKDIKTLTNNSDASPSGYRQRIFFRSAFYHTRSVPPSTSLVRFTHHPSKGYGDYNVYGPFTNHPEGCHTPVLTASAGGRNTNHYRRLSPRVQTSIYSAKASHAQLSDMPLRSDRASPVPYRAYSSYSEEGKASFSRRKKRLPVVVFFYLCT